MTETTIDPPDNTTNPPTNNTKATQWTRLSYKGIYHDNRRLLKHRAKNCVCYREIDKLPPMENTTGICFLNQKQDRRTRDQKSKTDGQERHQKW